MSATPPSQCLWKEKFLYNKNDLKLQISIIFKVSWSLKGSQGKNGEISGGLRYFMSSWQQHCLRAFPHYWKQESHVGKACREHIKSKVICKIAMPFSLRPKEVTALKLCEGGFMTKEDLHPLWHIPTQSCGFNLLNCLKWHLQILFSSSPKGDTVMEQKCYCWHYWEYQHSMHLDIPVAVQHHLHGLGGRKALSLSNVKVNLHKNLLNTSMDFSRRVIQTLTLRNCFATKCLSLLCEPKTIMQRST